MAESKLDLKIYEGTYRSKLRKQAAENSGFYMMRVSNSDVRVKATEKALETCFETDSEWIEMKKEFITAEKNFNALSAVYWTAQQKCRNLTNLVSGTTPQEFVQGLIEGTMNGIKIKKS